MQKIILFMMFIFLALSIVSPSNAISLDDASSTQATDGWLWWMTNPFVVTIILCIASIGMVLQLFQPHFSFGGMISIFALFIFYVTHMIAGYATWQSIFILVLGILLLLLELILPGGIVGILGFAAIIISLLSSGTDTIHMAYAILIALIMAFLGMVILMKFFGKKLNMFNKMVLNDSTDTEKGYVSNKNRTELLGLEAITTTPLRPSGTAMLGNERIDVVTEGGYIEAHKKVTIIKVEGVRIVVRESHQE
ncbi:NfeD family protein [Rummeliibacillus sp. SL167]|uniref:NfeD family protein n=1 Tax=Rummeliibacillus sp. SL167 TaxID=2579792 RepID=UPI0011B752E2|nr:NfeD family protein [Rummeliibacillus sp. SL167]